MFNYWMILMVDVMTQEDMVYDDVNMEENDTKYVMFFLKPQKLCG